MHGPKAYHRSWMKESFQTMTLSGWLQPDGSLSSRATRGKQNLVIAEQCPGEARLHLDQQHRRDALLQAIKVPMHQRSASISWAWAGAGQVLVGLKQTHSKRDGGLLKGPVNILLGILAKVQSEGHHTPPHVQPCPHLLLICTDIKLPIRAIKQCPKGCAA